MSNSLAQTARKRVDRWVKAVEEKGVEFPVDLDHAWPIIGYTEKKPAKAALLKKGKQGIDFIFGVQTKNKKSGRGRKAEKIFMTTRIFQHLCLMADTDKANDIREYFIEAERRYREIMRSLKSNSAEYLNAKDVRLGLCDSNKEVAAAVKVDITEYEYLYRTSKEKGKAYHNTFDNRCKGLYEKTNQQMGDYIKEETGREPEGTYSDYYEPAAQGFEHLANKLIVENKNRGKVKIESISKDVSGSIRKLILEQTGKKDYMPKLAKNRMTLREARSDNTLPASDRPKLDAPQQAEEEGDYCNDGCIFP